MQFFPADGIFQQKPSSGQIPNPESQSRFFILGIGIFSREMGYPDKKPSLPEVQSTYLRLGFIPRYFQSLEFRNNKNDESWSKV